MEYYKSGQITQSGHSRNHVTRFCPRDSRHSSLTVAECGQQSLLTAHATVKVCRQVVQQIHNKSNKWSWTGATHSLLRYAQTTDSCHQVLSTVDDDRHLLIILSIQLLCTACTSPIVRMTNHFKKDVI